MRTIEFRGKRVDNGEWVEGDLITYENETVSIRQPKTWFTQNVIPETVGQFTGPHDKNGKEIYEGDIILGKTFKHALIVEWDNQECGWMARSINSGAMYSLGTWQWEIIGNIHDNPDLLKEVSHEA